jgi:hypothetical protein
MSDPRRSRRTRSRARARRVARALRVSLAAGAALASLACASLSGGDRPEPPPALAGPGTPDPLESLRTRATPVPEAPDFAAHDLAAAALAGTPSEARLALRQLDEIERLRGLAGEPPSGLAAPGRYLVDATEADAIARRQASAALLRRRDVEPALRRQLEMEVEDDPLSLASRRLWESRRARVARSVNAVSEAAGRSMTSTVFAPIRLAQALVGVAVAEHMDDPISVQERQALAHWKQYVETHPESPQAPKLLRQIEALQRKWLESKRERGVRAARLALERGEDETALVLASRALLYAPEDPEASKLRNEAERRVEAWRRARARSLEAADAPPLDAEDPLAAALARALLDPEGDVPGAAAAVLAAGGPKGPLADEARFAEAIAAAEAGEETRGWELLGRVAGERGDERQMARHAAWLLANPEANPYAAFRRARVERVGERAGYVLLGPLARGARDRDLPRPVEYLLEGPVLLGTIGGIPSRLLTALVATPPARAPAVYARRYLARHPDGERAGEVRGWLIEYHEDAGHALAAWELARADGADPERLADLERRAAKQMLETAKKQKRQDLRLAMLGQIAEDHPDTDAGREAGRLAHDELTRATVQSIRISRGFFLENPVVAGPDGLGLRADLLDGRRENGELHPDGVRLVGGRVLELSLLAADGDEDDPPEIYHREVSSERLARLVALLEETAIRNALVDPLNDTAPDARRDHFFERAKLGVADAPDPRVSASSSFAFVGVREKYGMVRSREALLPVELVVQGSFPDLGLGAFPRLRMPRTTPDAVLYK